MIYASTLVSLHIHQQYLAERYILESAIPIAIGNTKSDRTLPELDKGLNATDNHHLLISEPHAPMDPKIHSPTINTTTILIRKLMIEITNPKFLSKGIVTTSNDYSWFYSYHQSISAYLIYFYFYPLPYAVPFALRFSLTHYALL